MLKAKAVCQGPSERAKSRKKAKSASQGKSEAAPAPVGTECAKEDEISPSSALPASKPAKKAPKAAKSKAAGKAKGVKSKAKNPESRPLAKTCEPAKPAPAKKRGLSLEEKCCRFESHFAKTEEIFTLKELEKIGPSIGVIAQAVKDVIVLLLKERRIKCEKVGASNIYWLFKHDLKASRTKEKRSLTAEIDQLRIALETFESSVAQLDPATVEKYAQWTAPERADRLALLRRTLLDERLTFKVLLLSHDHLTITTAPLPISRSNRKLNASGPYARLRTAPYRMRRIT